MFTYSLTNDKECFDTKKGFFLHLELLDDVADLLKAVNVAVLHTLTVGDHLVEGSFMSRQAF